MIIPDSITDRVISLKDQFFDLEGLSVYSALSVSTLRAHIRANGLPAFKVMGKILIRKSEFDKWISRYRINQAQDLESIVDDVIGLISRRSGNATL